MKTVKSSLPIYAGFCILDHLKDEETSLLLKKRTDHLIELSVWVNGSETTHTVSLYTDGTWFFETEVPV